MARTKLNDAVTTNGTAASEVPEDVQTAMKEYWLKLLDEAMEGNSELAKEKKRLRKRVMASLDAVMEESSLPEDEENPLELTDGELEDELQTEKTKLRRAERRLANYQELLEEEESRLKSFKKARISQEKTETAEVESKQHGSAKAVLSNNLVRQRKFPVGITTELKKEHRRLKAEDPNTVYDPAEDPFLQDLAARLKPVISKLS